MHRPRLRVSKSCQWCRQHRKKCDGKRPHCGPCQRRGYLCSWTNTSVTKLLESDPSPEVLDLVQNSVSNIESAAQSSVSQLPALNLSNASATLPSVAGSESDSGSSGFNFPAVSDRYGSGQRSLASTTDFSNQFDEHIIISGVLFGWDFVKSRFLLDSQWSAAILLDYEMVKLDYTIIHRMAALWFSRMKMKVRQARYGSSFRVRTLD